MRLYLVLVGIVICGCVNQPTGLTQDESKLDVYYEVPGIEYEDLGRIVATSTFDNSKATIKKVLGHAVDLDADAVLIHSSGNTKIGAHEHVKEVYQIHATAMRYIK